MNTQKSDTFVNEWKAKEKPLRRTSFTAQRTFDATPEEIFPLLCPTTELDWLPGWNCELLHSQSGYAELNCVLRTSFSEWMNYSSAHDTKKSCRRLFACL